MKSTYQQIRDKAGIEEYRLYSRQCGKDFMFLGKQKGTNVAILGTGEWKCEMCKYFDTDGVDGNSPWCKKQNQFHSKAILLNEDCPFGFEFGVPSCYWVNEKRNEERAKELAEKAAVAQR